MSNWDYSYLGLLRGEEDAEESQETLEDIAENSDYEELDRFTFSPDHYGWFYEDNPGCVIKAVKEEWCEVGRIAYSPYGDRYVMTEDEE